MWLCRVENAWQRPLRSTEPDERCLCQFLLSRTCPEALGMLHALSSAYIYIITVPQPCHLHTFTQSPCHDHVICKHLHSHHATTMSSAYIYTITTPQPCRLHTFTQSPRHNHVIYIHLHNHRAMTMSSAYIYTVTTPQQCHLHTFTQSPYHDHTRTDTASQIMLNVINKINITDNEC